LCAVSRSAPEEFSNLIQHFCGTSACPAPSLSPASAHEYAGLAHYHPVDVFGLEAGFRR